MGRKRSFLGFLATLFVAFFTANVFAAGYTCSSYKMYTSCKSGYYMVGSSSSTAYNGTAKTGNACIACSNAGSDCTCSGGSAAPVCITAGTTTVSKTSMTITYPTTTGTFTASCSGGATPTATSSATSVATVAMNSGTGTVTWKSAGSATITVSCPATTNYKASSKNVTVTIAKGTNPITLNATSGTIAYPNNGTFTVSNAQGTVTVKSGTTSVATASISSNTVTMKSVKPGSSTITVTAAGNSYYNSGSKTYALTVSKGTNPIALSASNGSINYNGTGTFTVSGAQGTLNVSSASTTVATVALSNTTVTMTGKQAGSTTITVTAAGNDYYNSGSKTYSLTVNKIAGTTTVSKTSMTITYPTTTGTFTASCSGGATPTATSSATGVATVAMNSGTGTVTWKSAGSATITVSCPATTNYNSSSKTVTVTIAKGTNTLALSATSGTLSYTSSNKTKSFTVSTNTSGGALSAVSSATGVATVAVSGTTVTATYVKAGSAKITVTSAATSYYNATTATYTLTVDCGAGYYSNSSACTICGAGTYTSSANTASSCTNVNAGCYGGQGATSACPTECATGSYSAAGASACTACSAGKTTSGTGKTSCDATCSNAAGVYGWATPSWSANAVSNLCTVSKCNANTYYTATTGTGHKNTCTSCGSNSSTSAGNTSTTCTCDQGYSADGTQNGTKTTTSAACKAIVYNISYTMNSGTNYSGAPTTYTYGVGATINGTPTRTGYTFVGWCTNYDLTENCAKTKTISATDLGDKIFYAKWTAKQYKVEYSCGDGTGTPPTNGTATYNQNFTPAANTCTRSGYTFNGWNDGSTTHAAGTAFKWTYTSDKTFTATWKLNGAIDIKYNTNGGTINNYGDAVACNAASAAFALPTNVTRAGYTFGGWYNNSNLTGTAITTVSAGACTGQLEYWAKWTACNSTTDGACNCASETYPSNGTCTNCSKSCSGVSGYTQGTYNVCNSETTDLCYRACVPSDINGATVVTGTITKGGVNTCVATTCDAEYFKQGDGCAKCPDNAETCGGGDDSWECDTGYEKSASGTACNAKKYTVTLDNQGATTAGTKSITATYNQKLGTITAPTKTDYAFGGYCTGKNGAGTCYYNASGVGVLAWNIDSNTTLYANWILDAFTCTAGKATDGTACTPGYYCPGGKVNADVKNDTTSGCERKCPSATGKTVNSQAGASASTQCYASGTVDIYESTNTTVTGEGTKTCNWNGEDSYNASCNIVPTSCIGGYYRPAGTSACEQADSGYYSPDGDLLQKQCPQKTNYTIGTDVVRDAEADCYVVCDSYVPGVENADKVYVTAGAEYQKMFYKNGAYPACQYTVECKTGYDAVSGATPQCKAKTYAITLNKNGGSGNIAETVNCTFNGNDCALPATSVLKRDGYNTANKWCTNADGTGACYEAGKVVSGNVSANGTDTQLYAIWTLAVFKIELSAPDADTNAAQGPVYLKYATGWYSDANASQPLTTLGTQLPGKGGEAYVFAGYELNGEMIIDANGSLSVSTGALTATTKDATATAQWTKGLTKCDAGTYYPGTGSSCVACTVATNGTHPKSDAGTTDSVNDCYKVCKPYEVVNGTAVPVSDKAYYPSDCEFEGKSPNGNPCDIVDGVCVETSCNYNFEMDNGVCKPCAREHAISYKQSGNCVVESCANGYHPNEQQCESDVVECSAPNAVVAKQTWDARKNAFGACMITECEEGYHLGANACQLDEQVCELEHGVGVREWNHKSNTWGECIATKCEPGYTNDPSLTNELWKQCGRCNNMYSANSELAVSSYVQGCEIAACMYQGELYALENNECRLICDTYSDETGARRWNASRKKCERTCEPGYTSW